MAFKLIMDEKEMAVFDDITQSSGQSKSATINQLLSKAVELNLTPKMSILSSNDAMPTFHLYPTIESKLKKHIKEKGYSLNNEPSKVLSGLVRAVIDNKHDNDETLSDLDEFIEQFFSTAGKHVRDQQQTLIHHLVEQHTSKSVSLHEASTGIGKTAAKLCAASYLLKKGVVNTAVIAVPTNKLITQICKEATAFGVDVRQLKSRREFISPTAIELALEETPNDTDVLAFIIAEIEKANTYELSRLPKAVIDAVDQLKSGIGCDNSTPEDDLALQEYQRYIESFNSAGIIVTTHSMLALDLQMLLFKRNGVIAQYSEKTGKKISYKSYTDDTKKLKQRGLIAPSYDEWFCDLLIALSREAKFEAVSRLPYSLTTNYNMALFIDEAHLYKSNVELSLSSSVSLNLLISRLSSVDKMLTGKQKQQSKAMIKALSILSDMPVDTASDAIKYRLIDFIDLFKHSRSWTSKGSGQVTTDELRLNRIKKSIESLITFSEDYHDVFITSSRKQKRKSIHSNHDSFNTWLILSSTHQLTHSVSYTSGTLNDSTGQYRHSIGALRLKSSAAKNRLVTNASLNSDWLFKNVTLTVNHQFIDNFQYAEKAKVIVDELADRSGGALLLGNSFEEIEAIALEIQRLTNGAFPLIWDTPRGAKNNAKEFLELYKENGKTIYLATGAAWQGIDITDSDVPANEDNLIQTLIITRAPFENIIRSDNSELAKYQWLSYLHKTYVKFKQGLGRLVRRSGRENMHLLYLDAEYHKESRREFKHYLERNYQHR